MNVIDSALFSTSWNEKVLSTLEALSQFMSIIHIILFSKITPSKRRVGICWFGCIDSSYEEDIKYVDMKKNGCNTYALRNIIGKILIGL